ncbi:MAG: fatty acid desaturase [Chloroflexota bacterium]|nr:MAG: fatty acid desaturase [Chloroflexota bacterium]
MNELVQNLQNVKWIEIVRKYQEPDLPKAVEQILTSVFVYVGLMIVMAFTIRISYWTLLLVIPTAGFAVRTFIIFHDCGHQSFFGAKNKRANDVLGVITGILTFTPYHFWRRAHAMHHATVAKLDQRGKGDVWMLTVDEWNEASKWKKLIYRVYRNPLVLFTLGAWINMIVAQRIPFPGMDPQDKRSILLTDLALLLIGVSVILLFGWKAYLLIQILVMMIASSIGVWLFYVQHQFPGAYWARKGEWDYLSACLQGSSYYKLPEVLRFFTGNIGFHHLHHLSHLVPNYHLPRLYRQHPELAVEPITLRDTRKLLAIRLYDEGKRSYVGYPG